MLQSKLGASHNLIKASIHPHSGWPNRQSNVQSALIVLPCGIATVPAHQTQAPTHGLQMAPAVSERSEKTETGTTGAKIGDTDPDPKSGGETEVDPETGPRSPARSGAAPEKEAGEDTTASETGRETDGTGNEAGVGRSIGRVEVGAYAIHSGKTRLTEATDGLPSRRSRSRSRSPRRDHTTVRTRTRTPTRSSKPPRSRSPPSKPATDRTGPRTSTRNPPPKPLPTTDSTPKPAAKTNGTTSTVEPSKTDAMEVDADSDPEIAEMRRAMGFTGFKSTKNTKVKGNNVSGVRKEKKTEYRQYMNRVGGFNRPLSPSR